MRKIAKLMAATAFTTAMIAGAVSPSATAEGRGAAGSHTYVCANKGGGPNHTVNCTGAIIVNSTVSDTTVNVVDQHVLNNGQINDMQVGLTNVSNNNANRPVQAQLHRLENTVIAPYVRNFGSGISVNNIQVCAPVFGVCV